MNNYEEGPLFLGGIEDILDSENDSRMNTDEEPMTDDLNFIDDDEEMNDNDETNKENRNPASDRTSRKRSRVRPV